MKIRNWEKFQHFKDRRPPWIKVYREILDDPDWHNLDPKDAKILVMLWLIASEDEEKQGNLPCLKKLAFRLRSNEKDLEKSLYRLTDWLIQDDINLISTRYHDDTPETETETKGETEKESKNAARFVPPSIQEVKTYCQQRGNQIDAEQFVAFYESKGWKVGNQKMKSWQSAIVTWEKRLKEKQQASPGQPAGNHPSFKAWKGHG